LRSRLEPEDRRGDALQALGGRLPEQELGNLGFGLDAAGVQLRPVVLAEGLGMDANDLGDVSLGNTIGYECLDLLAVTFIQGVRAASHVTAP
jgi:hypothetical protein